ncbi:lysoplasmalogenase [Arsenicibacter rosenii]|uniref:Lysoplasmalogenase n=1 Tax=Arsenicibacter rosenii TaxID=1750698 RepID=A0A1S2VDW1_9BACT|nr:lysoplasmalogenase [Arsenicibacter rosenii]OIN56600.1 hypothetical protein BLX24_24345 [Arsenicibacter rosenii]
MRSTNLLFPVFWAITGIEISGDLLDIAWMHFGFKPLIMISLMVFVWQHRPLLTMFASLRWLLAGMFFALGGDIFLMIPKRDLFVPGLASFLVMQLCYIIAFFRSVRENGHTITGLKWLSHALPFVIYSGAFVVYLRSVFDANSALQPLWMPVVLYVICISSMGVSASARLGAVLTGSFWRVSLGAVLFILSDTVIALNKFVFRVPLAPLLVMFTYAAAQYLIIIGMLREHQLTDERIQKRNDSLLTH